MRIIEGSQPWICRRVTIEILRAATDASLRMTDVLCGSNSHIYLGSSEKCLDGLDNHIVNEVQFFRLDYIRRKHVDDVA